jgi:hypothetical protein
VFQEQEDFIAAFKRGELDRDVVAVIRFQGPRANGMPELHNLSPSISVLLDRGFKVALVTDGRMSGASGKVPAAIHVTPEVLEPHRHGPRTVLHVPQFDQRGRRGRSHLPAAVAEGHHRAPARRRRHRRDHAGFRRRLPDP